MPQATKKAACCRKKPRSGENSTRSVPSRQGHRRKAEKLLRQQQKESRRRAAKDLIGLVRSCRLGVLIRGLQNLEAPFGKVLILFVRSRHCGELNRGLENLGTPCTGKRFYSFRLYEKNQKYPRGLRTSGLRGGFKALSKKILADLPAVRVEPGFSHKTAAKRL